MLWLQAGAEKTAVQGAAVLLSHLVDAQAGEGVQGGVGGLCVRQRPRLPIAEPQLRRLGEPGAQHPLRQACWQATCDQQNPAIRSMLRFWTGHHCSSTRSVNPLDVGNPHLLAIQNLTNAARWQKHVMVNMTSCSRHAVRACLQGSTWHPARR